MSYYFLEPPIPLVSTAEPPPFPLEELPAVLQNYVKQISNALQVHHDMPSALSLAVLAACVQGKTKIRITPEWQEELNLYTAVIAEPGERKSAVFPHLQRRFTAIRRITILLTPLKLPHTKITSNGLKCRKTNS